MNPSSAFFSSLICLCYWPIRFHVRSIFSSTSLPCIPLPLFFLLVTHLPLSTYRSAFVSLSLFPREIFGTARPYHTTTCLCVPQHDVLYCPKRKAKQNLLLWRNESFLEIQATGLLPATIPPKHYLRILHLELSQGSFRRQLRLDFMSNSHLKAWLSSSWLFGCFICLKLPHTSNIFNTFIQACQKENQKGENQGRG